MPLFNSVEDITGKYEASEEITDPQTGKTTIRRVMDLDEVVKRIVAPIYFHGQLRGWQARHIGEIDWKAEDAVP